MVDHWMRSIPLERRTFINDFLTYVQLFIFMHFKRKAQRILALTLIVLDEHF